MVQHKICFQVDLRTENRQIWYKKSDKTYHAIRMLCYANMLLLVSIYLQLELNRPYYWVIVSNYSLKLLKWYFFFIFKVQGLFICHSKTQRRTTKKAVVCLCYIRKKIYMTVFKLRSLTAWGKMLLCSLAVRQQIPLYLLWTDCGWDGCRLLVSCRPCADISLISLMLCVSGCFNHPPQSRPVLGHARTSQDAFYCSSVNVDQNLTPEFSLLKFP